MRACVLAILSMLAAILTPAAEACMWKAQPRFMFWNKPPDTVAPGEVALEVEFIGFASWIELLAIEGKPPEEAPFNTDCGAPFAYDIRHVIHGQITAQRIVVFQLDNMIDETTNPWKRRILVGTPGEIKKITTASGDDWRDHAFSAQYFEIHFPAARTPSGEDVFFSG